MADLFASMDFVTMTPNELKRRFPNASASTLARNGIVGVEPPPPAKEIIAAACPAPMEIRHTNDEAKLNKTEYAYLLHLRAQHGWVGVQCFTLKLADDCRYSPDLWTHDRVGFTAWEIKGFWRDDAKVKIKVAARLYPMIRFVVVQKVKGQWEHTPVKP